MTEEKIVDLIERAGFNGVEAFNAALEIYTEGIIRSSIAAIFLSIAGLVLAYFIMRFVVKHEDIIEEPLCIFGFVASLIIAVVSLIYSFHAIFNLAAPKYYALRQLLESFG